MKKLTAGIFATLLAVVSTGAANAEIASKGYVDETVGAVSTEVDSLSTTVGQHTTQIGTINTTIGGYGDVVTHNASEFATAAQGTKADTAVQPAAISDMQVKANLTTNAEWATEKTADDKYPSNAAVDAAIKSATSELPTSDTITEIQGDVTQLQTDVSKKQDKNMGAEAANHIVTTDGTGNITSSATIANTQVSGLGTLATKSTVTSADITDGTIAEGDLNASINASLDKADSAVQPSAITDMQVKGNLTNADGWDADKSSDTKYPSNAAVNAAITDATSGLATDSKMGDLSSLTTTVQTNLVGAINEVDANADAAKTAAEAAQSTATQAQTTANAAIPKPSGTCAEPTSKCVLTYNNSQYAWEVIERGADGE